MNTKYLASHIRHPIIREEASLMLTVGPVHVLPARLSSVRKRHIMGRKFDADISGCLVLAGTGSLLTHVRSKNLIKVSHALCLLSSSHSPSCRRIIISPIFIFDSNNDHSCLASPFSISSPNRQTNSLRIQVSGPSLAYICLGGFVVLVSVRHLWFCRPRCEPSTLPKLTMLFF